MTPQLGHVTSHYAKDYIFVSNDLFFPWLRFDREKLEIIYTPELGSNNSEYISPNTEASETQAY